MKGVIWQTGEIVQNKTEAIKRAKVLLEQGRTRGVEDIIILYYSDLEHWFSVGYHDPECVNYVQVKKEIE